MTSGEQQTASLAVIAGSGLYSLEDYLGSSPLTLSVETPYSQQAVEVQLYKTSDKQIAFLPRHGRDHRLPPHRIPYKANLYALRELGVMQILAVNAVGGISNDLEAGSLVIPDQIIDYTWGRDHSYYDDLTALDQHIDFTYPYDDTLRQLMADTLHEMGIPFVKQGVYGCTQGPRLETAAEIRRMANDGCTIVGQTTMPETALARELGMQLASLCLVVNRAAGLDEEPLSIEEIIEFLHSGMKTVGQVICRAIR
jgi:5'-deoxy-5'-methylthioadenosine phosphorylase